MALLKMPLEYANRLRDIEDNQNKIVVKNRYYAMQKNYGKLKVFFQGKSQLFRKF
ncbi:hypothetical protein [Brunnivagina elsteri]|uniref:hypothetical protein n=1 Tax=Brunnivagina elsteri TaxID=1247191 RepID=UPI0013046367|nr:hypothetical protein [Calothrix elsteri]